MRVALLWASFVACTSFACRIDVTAKQARTNTSEEYQTSEKARGALFNLKSLAGLRRSLADGQASAPANALALLLLALSPKAAFNPSVPTLLPSSTVATLCWSDAELQFRRGWQCLMKTSEDEREEDFRFYTPALAAGFGALPGGVWDPLLKGAQERGEEIRSEIKRAVQRSYGKKTVEGECERRMPPFAERVKQLSEEERRLATIVKRAEEDCRAGADPFVLSLCESDFDTNARDLARAIEDQVFLMQIQMEAKNQTFFEMLSAAEKEEQELQDLARGVYSLRQQATAALLALDDETEQLQAQQALGTWAAEVMWNVRPAADAYCNAVEASWRLANQGSELTAELRNELQESAAKLSFVDTSKLEGADITAPTERTSYSAAQIIINEAEEAEAQAQSQAKKVKETRKQVKAKQRDLEDLEDGIQDRLIRLRHPRKAIERPEEDDLEADDIKAKFQAMMKSKDLFARD